MWSILGLEGEIMRKSSFMLGSVMASLLAGCASTHVPLGPVGPNPAVPPTISANGRLEVLSDLEVRRDANEFAFNPVFYQHTDYDIYNLRGGKVRHVSNSTGKYSEDAEVVSLPPGKYIIKAQAQGYARVSVPVVIEPGRRTRVHLDAKWSPPQGTQTAVLVITPGGYPVGWRSD